MSNELSQYINLADLLELHKKEIFLSLNCHAIARVEEFDPVNQTVTATINYAKTFLEEGDDGKAVPVTRPYPTLAECPAVIVGGGGGHLTFPIKAGDDCLILFNDRDMDNWIQGGTGAKVATNRLHAFSDAIALVGLHNQANLISDYDTTRAVLRKGAAMVGVGDSKVKIANAVTTLNTLLGTLIDQLITLSNTSAVAGSPINPAVATQLTAIKTQIAGLLE